MNEIEELLKESVRELEGLLNAKHVLAEPIEKDGTTVIPMVSYGFGFGVGGGEESKKGSGRGSGAGGGIKPVALIIIDKNGVRVEKFKGSMFENIADCCSRMMEGKSATKSEQKHEENSAA